jgi:hypothetical protein
MKESRKKKSLPYLPHHKCWHVIGNKFTGVSSSCVNHDFLLEHFTSMLDVSKTFDISKTFCTRTHKITLWNVDYFGTWRTFPQIGKPPFVHLNMNNRERSMLDRGALHGRRILWNGNQRFLKHSKTKYQVVVLVTNPRLAIGNNLIGFWSLDVSEQMSVNLFSLTLAKLLFETLNVQKQLMLSACELCIINYPPAKRPTSNILEIQGPSASWGAIFLRT